MNIGISSYSFAYSVGIPGKIKGGFLSPEGLIDRAVELDCTVLQIADNLPLHTLSRERIEGLRKHADRSGVTIELGTAGTKPNHIKTYLKLAGKLGCSMLRTVCEPVSSFEDQKAIVANMMTSLPALEHSGVTICLENTENIAAEVLADTVRQINHPNVAVCLDVANSLGRGEGVREVVEYLGPYTRNLHVKDCKPVRVPTNLGFIVQGCRLGEGIIDFAWIIRKLDGFGVRNDFNIILEQWIPITSDEKSRAAVFFNTDTGRKSLQQRRLITGCASASSSQQESDDGTVDRVRGETDEEIRKREEEWAAYGVDYLKKYMRK